MANIQLERAPKQLADASPEKRLFIFLLTRDISLIAAFLDLIDNSINATVEPISKRLETAEDYLRVLEDDTIKPTVDIRISLAKDEVKIVDTAPGISAKTAVEHVFKFGRGENEEQDTDRLSVYGIGLKRALFKLGNRIKIISDHKDGGFELDLDVKAWSKIKTQPWTFEITPRPATTENCGTTITVTQLYDDVTRRLEDGVFEGQLRDAISRAYAYYLAKFVNIYVGKTKIDGANITMGENYGSDHVKRGDVTCAITAGIGTPEGNAFRDKSSGWFVFCNGRAVITADKTPLTGWVGGGAGLPVFQPKHRPFLGTVFFVSKNADQLPWNTTKSGINEDSALWQEAKRHMLSVGRQVISFLDGRYTDEGTEIVSKDLQDAAGQKKMSMFSASVSVKKSFEVPKKPPAVDMKIQYYAKIAHVKAIEEYLRRPGMGGAEVGRYTFNYFVRNEVGEE